MKSKTELELELIELSRELNTKMLTPRNLSRVMLLALEMHEAKIQQKDIA